MHDHISKLTAGQKAWSGTMGKRMRCVWRERRRRDDRYPFGGSLIHPRRAAFTISPGKLRAQLRDGRGPWWTARRSPRKRVMGQLIRGFESHTLRHCDVASY
jgi:hypothetical protein